VSNAGLVAPAADHSLARLISALAVGWFIASAALGFSGFVAAHGSLIAFFVPAPATAFGLALCASRRLRNWVAGFDAKTLVSAQAVRAAGMAFLAACAVGSLNAKFALWAGLLDCVVGFSAPFVAGQIKQTLETRQRWIVIAWAGVGLLDFLVAIPLARVCRLEDPTSMTAMGYPPLSLITTYLVPLALIDYSMLAGHLWGFAQRSPSAAGRTSATPC
jgi:hypothetical protein